MGDRVQTEISDRDLPKWVIGLDRNPHLDSTEIPVYGQQEQSAYNGHFASTCYHPLLLFNREGDCLAVKLRPGNVHSAEQWDAVLLPEIERQQQHAKEVVVRADAGFAKPELYEALEARGVAYAIRIPSNDILEREVAGLLTRSVGRPSYKPVVRYKSFRYQAASWTTARRVVAKIEFHCGELFPRVGFIVTTLGTDSKAVVHFYNKRGTAEMGQPQYPRRAQRVGSRPAWHPLLPALRLLPQLRVRHLCAPPLPRVVSGGTLVALA